MFYPRRPYVCAEWNFGGFPLWLTDVASLVDRTSSPAWEAQMGAFFARMVESVRDFFADRGGPIALAQVENEYNGGDSSYVAWCGELAANFTFGNQYEMCNGASVQYY